MSVSSSNKRGASVDIEEDEWTPVVVLESLFSPRVPTGCAFMGPTGILLVRKACMPKGIRSVHSFDMGEIDAEDAEDELLKQLLGLVASGDAKMVPAALAMHVSTKAARLLDPHESSDEE